MLPQPLQPQPQQQQQQVQPGTTHYPESSGQMQQRQLLQQQLALRQLLLQQQHRKRQLQLQLRREPAVLTALIKHSTSWQRLQQLFHSFTPLFNPIHVSAALTHLAQLQQQRLSPQQLQQAPDGFKQLVQELTAAAVACIPDFGPRQVANSLWAIRGLGAGSSVTHRTRNSFLDAFAGRIQYAAPQHVAVMAAAIADMDWGTSTEWCTLLREVRRWDARAHTGGSKAHEHVCPPTQSECCQP
jgi:hypothetical protein